MLVKIMESEFKVLIHLWKIGIDLCGGFLSLCQTGRAISDILDVQKGHSIRRLKCYCYCKDRGIMFICSVRNIFSECVGMENLFTA